jgi:glycerophosphoryl diester phosphodiesterase
MSLLFILGLGAAQVELIAHRGSSEEAPENTLASFRLGWQHADACELDIFPTKDGQIAVIHDATTKRTAGLDKPVAQQTMAELKALDAGSWKAAKWAGEKIPTLREVLEILPEKKRLYIEIKGGAELLPELQRTVQAFAAKEPQLLLIGFNYDTMTEAKRLFPKIPAYWILSYKIDKKTLRHPDLDDLIAKCRAGGLDGLDLDFAFPIDKDSVAKIHAAGLKLCTWTVNDPEVARKEVEAGVDGVTSDRPELLRQKLSTPR